MCNTVKIIKTGPSGNAPALEPAGAMAPTASCSSHEVPATSSSHQLHVDAEGRVTWGHSEQHMRSAL